MNVIKAAICTILSILICILPSAFALTASADTVKPLRYAYVDLGATVYLCTDKNKSSAIFAIPETYCVEILKEENGWLYVRYAEDSGIYRAVTGYCLKDELVPCDRPLEKPYLYSTVTVRYSADETGGVLPGLSDLEMPAAYYGAYTVAGVKYSYVLCGDSFGYVSGSLENYPLNTLPTSPTFSETPPPATDTALISVIAILGIAALAVVVLFVSCRKPPRDKSAL